MKIITRANHRKQQANSKAKQQANKQQANSKANSKATKKDVR